jgi:hypothetical protein
MANISPQAKAESAHRSQDHTRRHSKDATLRKMGFEIHDRPKHGQDRWRRKSDGKVMTEAAALESIGNAH